MEAKLSAEDRVKVAEDALSWLRAGALRATQGTYVNPSSRRVTRSTILDRVGDKMETQMRDVVLGPCDVCAVGALLIASIVRYDSCTVDEFERLHPRVLLSRWFDDDQVRLMECAFETYNQGWLGSKSVQAQAFGLRFVLASKRLEAILQNVIDNGGDFVP
jgi:hypothetical protein